MPPKTFDISCLADNLIDLLADIQNHVEITLTLQGIPWAKVLPLSLENVPPQKDPDAPIAGLNRGSMVMSDDFDDPLPDSFWGL